MPDEMFTRPAPLPAARKSSLRGLLLTAAFAFLLGCGLVGWLAWTGTLRLDLGAARPKAIPSALPAMPLASSVAAPTPSSSPSLPAADPAAMAITGGLDQRLAGLEQRMTRLDLQASAAEGNASRAEGLLIAFAARRALERGAPLGYLEDQLKLRFGAAQPAALDAILTATRQPATLDQLVGQLEALAPSLADPRKDESGWQKFQREMGNLFVIHRESSQAAPPAQRIERAKLLLRTGQIEPAIAEVASLPGNAGATNWMTAARRYDRAMRGLDLIETAALQETHALKDANGQLIQQASPVGPAAPTTP